MSQAVSHAVPCAVTSSPGHDTKIVLRLKSLSRMSQRFCIVSQGAVVLYRNLAVPYRDTKGRSPITIQKLYRDLEPMSRVRWPVSRARWVVSQCRVVCAAAVS